MYIQKSKKKKPKLNVLEKAFRNSTERRALKLSYIQQLNLAEKLDDIDEEITSLKSDVYKIKGLTHAIEKAHQQYYEILLMTSVIKEMLLTGPKRRKQLAFALDAKTKDIFQISGYIADL